jgi:Rrf2 family protein
VGKLFNISIASSIAVHSLALIANSDEMLNASRISDRLKLSKNHISKVLQLLVKFKIITATRGPSGGFQLLRSPESVSVFEIMEIIDGRIEVPHCGHEEETCPFEDCVFGDERQRLMEEFKSYYSNRKLSDIKISVG